MRKFYLVWNEGGSNPTFKHVSLESAEREAIRLAKLNPNCEFHVLESLITLEVPNPAVTKSLHIHFQDDVDSYTPF